MFLSFQTGEEVALKKVPLRKLDEGIPNTALRYFMQSILLAKYISKTCFTKNTEKKTEGKQTKDRRGKGGVVKGGWENGAR